MGVKFNPLIYSGLDFSGSGGGSGAVDSVNGQTGVVELPLYDVEAYELTGTDISNKYVTLPNAPYETDKVRLVPIGGIEQYNSVDFEVTGSQVSWDSLGYESLAEAGDIILVVYRHI